MEVAPWLYGVGLGRYEQRSENDIDGEFLMDLTAENLIGLGVASGRPQAARRRAPPRLNLGDHVSHTCVRSHDRMSWPCGTRCAVYAMLEILMSQFRNRRRRAIHLIPAACRFDTGAGQAASHGRLSRELDDHSCLRNLLLLNAGIAAACRSFAS